MCTCCRILALRTEVQIIDTTLTARFNRLQHYCVDRTASHCLIPLFTQLPRLFKSGASQCLGHQCSPPNALSLVTSHALTSFGLEVDGACSMAAMVKSDTVQVTAGMKKADFHKWRPSVACTSSSVLSVFGDPLEGSIDAEV